MVVNLYLNFVAGFAVLLQLQSGRTHFNFFKGNLFYLNN